LQCSLRVWKRLSTTAEPHAFANVVPPLFTSVAGIARQSNFQRHLVTNVEVGDFRAYTNNHACRLMAQGHGFLNEDVAIAVMSVVMQI
jgi:hypothetical protein